MDNNLGDLDLAATIGSIPEREPTKKYRKWLNDLEMLHGLEEFFLRYSPHGLRSLGAINLLGADQTRDIDAVYSTTTVGRILVFGDCYDGSYVGVNIDSGVPCWIKEGHLEGKFLEEGIVAYPESLANFLISATTEPTFPADPYEAEERY